MDFVGVICTLRSNFLFTAIAFQIFEWFSAWYMIRSQVNLDMTTVSVERHKVQRGELIVRNVFYSLVSLSFICSIAYIVYGYILNHRK